MSSLPWSQKYQDSENIRITLRSRKIYLQFLPRPKSNLKFLKVSLQLVFVYMQAK